jgi:hypothetical protein
MQIRSFQVLRPDGKLISIVSQPDQGRAKHDGVTAAFFLVEVPPSGCAALVTLSVAVN